MSLQDSQELVAQLGDDSVQQMLLLAERLRESHGGELDDEAIQAVSEATGAPIDYVRIALARRAGTDRQTLTKKLRSTYLSLDPEERSWVMAGALGAGAGVAYALNSRFPMSNGLFGILMIALALVGFYAVASSKTSKLAILSGAILGGMGVLGSSIFGLMLGLTSRGAPFVILPITVGGAILGYVSNSFLKQNRKRLGLTDPAEERQDLLRQLVDLQERLTSGEQRCTFLSVDIVGSTALKASAPDQLSVEYTFSEYHRFVEMVVAKYGGRIHSTAGDGVTCTFDAPQQAFAAAKNLQVGLIEVNTFKNKLGSPLVLRCGIHTGSVVAPDARDMKSVNFSHVIDIAAHLQKACPPGSIVVSQEAAIHIPGGPRMVGEERVEAHEVTGFVWQPRAKMTAIPASAPSAFVPEQA